MTMRLMIFASAGLLALAACSGGHKDESPLTENGESANLVVPEANEVAPPAVVIENASNVETPAAPPPAFSDEQQTRDDADASGLTTRLPDEETKPADAGNQVEKQ